MVTEFQSAAIQLENLTDSEGFPLRIYHGILDSNELNDAGISLESITKIERRIIELLLKT